MIDPQAAGDPAVAYPALRAAAVADPLAAAISKQFPDRFAESR